MKEILVVIGIVAIINEHKPIPCIQNVLDYNLIG